MFRFINSYEYSVISTSFELHSLFLFSFSYDYKSRHPKTFVYTYRFSLLVSPIVVCETCSQSLKQESTITLTIVNDQYKLLPKVFYVMLITKYIGITLCLNEIKKIKFL